MEASANLSSKGEDRLSKGQISPLPPPPIRVQLTSKSMEVMVLSEVHKLNLENLRAFSHSSDQHRADTLHGFWLISKMFINTLERTEQNIILKCF